MKHEQLFLAGLSNQTPAPVSLGEPSMNDRLKRFRKRSVAGPVSLGIRA
jgi:hypothetical protein